MTCTKRLRNNQIGLLDLVFVKVKDVGFLMVKVAEMATLTSGSFQESRVCQANRCPREASRAIPVLSKSVQVHRKCPIWSKESKRSRSMRVPPNRAEEVKTSGESERVADSKRLTRSHLSSHLSTLHLTTWHLDMTGHRHVTTWSVAWWLML